MERIVLGYSGGLDTSMAIPWLAERFGADVIAVTLDLGQGGDLADVRERALAIGAIRAHVLDVRDEFAREYVTPVLRAGATHEDVVPLATPLARALIAKKLVEVAWMEGAEAIAHASRPNGRNATRIDAGVRALDPAIDLIVPERDRSLSRADQLAYARARNIPLSASVDACEVDTNLWGRSLEPFDAAQGKPFDAAQGRRDEGDDRKDAPDHLYVLTRAPQACPDEPACIEIELHQGIPIRANGIEMPLVELIESVETIAGAHGVGRIDGRAAGSPNVVSHRMCEAPAAVVLQLAHAALETRVLPRDLSRLKQSLARTYVKLVDNGSWFSPAREAIDAFVGSAQRQVTGTVRLELLKGECSVIDVRPSADASAVAPALRLTRRSSSRRIQSNLEPVENSKGL
jgi:argininosuccinate synthase